MRRTLIILAILFTFLALLGGGAYYLIKQQIEALPLDDLNFSIAGFGFKHIRVTDLSFTYVEPIESRNSAAATPLRAKVALQDAFITWEWHRFRPELQIIEVDSVDLSLNHWPQPQPTTGNDTLAEWEIPEDWRLPADLPHSVQVKNLKFDLPCAAGRCQYKGRVNFESENKERFITSDQPQNTRLSAFLSPQGEFEHLQQINLHLSYQVQGNIPTLELVLQSPMALNMEWSQQVDRSNTLRGNLDLELDPNAQWIFDQVWRWFPDYETSAEPALKFLNDSLQITASYRSELPDNSLQRWINELSGDLTLTAALNQQFVLQAETHLARNDEIQLSGEANFQLFPGMASHLTAFLPESALPLVDQWQRPAELELNWDFELPPGTLISSWPQQAAGEIQYNLSTDNSFQIENVGAMQVQSNGTAQFLSGDLSHIDLLADGFLNLEQTMEVLGEEIIQPGQINWSLHLQTEGAVDLQALPLHIQAQTSGFTDISLNSRLVVDTQSLSAQSEYGLLTIRQPGLQVHPAVLSELELHAPFELQLTEAQQLQIQSVDLTTLNFAAVANLDETFINMPSVSVQLSEWQWQSDLTELAASRFTSDIDITINPLQAPFLQSLDWRWFGSVTAQPLKQQGAELSLNGRLTNSAGIIVRNQTELDASQLVIDWELADIFWLAGNPIAGSTTAWPELISFERGRSRASGQVNMPFDDSPLQLTSLIEFIDVAGIANTAAFSGLRTEISVELTGQSLSAEIAEGHIQRVEYGMNLGPGDFNLRYAANLQDPIAGILELGPNRLSVMNGVLSLTPASFDLSQSAQTLHVNISQLDLARLLAEYPATDIHGSGLLSGSIPIRLTADGVFVEQGTLSALPPGGEIRYRSEQVQRMAQSNAALGIVMKALDDFHYSDLQGDVTYSEDGTLLLGLLIQGRNPTLENGRPVRLHVTLEEDLPALITSLQLVNQLNEIIQERVQQRFIRNIRN